jgi:predicted ribosome quality control (RQC) complex YloA/Tae2 family protein
MLEFLSKSRPRQREKFSGKYRASKRKAQKTIEASTKALKAAESRRSVSSLDAQKRGKQLVTVSSANHWFENHWFITSDNYLVLRTMRIKTNNSSSDACTEIYLHADVHGASSCVLA